MYNRNSFVPLIKISPFEQDDLKATQRNCVVDLLIREKPQAVILIGVFDVLRAV